MAHQQPESDSPTFSLEVPAGFTSPDPTVELTSVAEVIAFYEDHAGYDSGVPLDDLYQMLVDAGVDPRDVRSEVERLKENGEAYNPGDPERTRIRSTMPFHTH